MRMSRVVSQRSFGGPEVLAVVEVARPAPGPGEVLVRVRAAGLNPADRKLRSGHVRVFGEPPFTVGHEFSGDVTELGDGVTGLRPGDEVFGWVLPPHGAHADHVVVPTTALAPRPASLDHVHAAALPIAGLTAYQALTRVAPVRAGQRVYVLGAAGGVGHLAVRIAKARGAHVLGAARAANHDLLRDLGVDELVDHTTEDIAGPRAVDLVLDTVSGPVGVAALDTLAPGGTLVDVVGLGIDRAPATARAAALGVRFVEHNLDLTAGDLTAFGALVDEIGLRPFVSAVLPLTEVAKAHELGDRRQVRGKVVLVP